MSLIYNFREFDKRINDRITIKVSFYLKDTNENIDEYIQGILKSVDMENEILTIEQHFTFHNFLLKLDTVNVIRTFKNKEFFLITCGNLKVSK
jgi:hypothetical protein